MRFLILVLLLIKKSEPAISFYDGNSDQDDVLSCVNRIVKRHFDPERQVTIFSHGSKDYVDGMESTIRMVATISMPDKTSWFPETKQAVVFLDGDFYRDVKILMSLGTFHPRSRFIIVCTIGQSGLSTNNYLTKVVHHLHRNGRWMVAIAVKSIPQEIHLYGYTRTAHGKCGEPETIHFGNCSSEKNVGGLFSTTYNYNKCPLRLATYDWPPFMKFVVKNGQKIAIGIESHIVETIVARLNASALFVETSPSDIRTIIKNHDADIGYGQLAVYAGNEFWNTVCYGVIRGLVLIPKQSIPKNAFLNSFMPLEITVWIALMVVVIFIIILRIILPDFRAISMLDLLSLFLGFSVNMRHTRSSVRVYFIALVWFGYIATQGYLANLTMIFTKDSTEDIINTLDELEKSKISVGGVLWFASQFLKEKYPRLYETYEVMDLNQFKQALEELRTGHGTVAVYVEVSRFNHYNYWERATIVPEVITSYPVAMFVPNSSTISPICNKVIGRILQAGLMIHWEASWAQKYKKLEEDMMTDEANYEKGHMGLQQLLRIFELLGTALGFCTIVFIIELLVKFWKTKPQV